VAVSETELALPDRPPHGAPPPTRAPPGPSRSALEPYIGMMSPVRPHTRDGTARCFAHLHPVGQLSRWRRSGFTSQEWPPGMAGMDSVPFHAMSSMRHEVAARLSFP